MARDTNPPDWSPATVTDAVTDLQADGYTVDFSVADGGMLRCNQCRSLHDPAEARVDRIARFEGDSDPGDEAIVFGRGADGEPTAEDWARATGTISYEIVTRIGARVPRVYVGGDR